MAKGVRRTQSKFGARLEPFMHVDVQFAARAHARHRHPGRDALPVRGRHRRRLRPLHRGTAMLETAERLVAEESEPAVQQYLLLLGGAARAGRGCARADARARLVPAAVARGRRVRAVVRHVRAVRCAGTAPQLQRRRRRHALRQLPAARRGDPAPETVRLLGALLAGDWATVEAVDRRYRKAASGIVAAYLQWHLERSLRSLAHVER